MLLDHDDLAYQRGIIRDLVTLIENNYFTQIRAQAIEVDHFASGHVLLNSVSGAQSGVTLNDSFESLVEGNSLAHCDFGVYFMKVFDQRWVNTTNRVFNNTEGIRAHIATDVVGKEPGKVTQEIQKMFLKYPPVNR